VIYPADTMALEQAMMAIKDKSFLKVGETYDLDKVKAERQRIDTHLKEKRLFLFW